MKGKRRDRTLAIHGTIAGLAVVAAYVAWLKPLETPDAGEVTVLSGRADDLTEIGWSDASSDLTVKRNGGDIVVQIQAKKPTPTPTPPAKAEEAKPADAKTDPKADAKADAKADPKADPKATSPKSDAAKPDAVKADAAKPDAGTAAKPAGQEAAAPTITAAPPVRTFPPTREARELFAKLVPFYAVRSLGTPDPEHLKTFGLAEPSATLRLVLGGTEHTLKIGGSTFGTSHIYVQAASGEVFLVKSTQLAELRNGANALAERNVMPFEKGKIARVAIHAGPRTRELVQRNREDTTKAFWADPAEPDGELKLTGNWIDRLLRTRMVDFGTSAPQGAPAVTVEMIGDSGSLGTLNVWAPAAGATNGTAAAQSSAFRSPVTIPGTQAEAIIRELDQVFGENP